MKTNHLDIIKQIAYKLLWVVALLVVLDVFYRITFYRHDLKSNRDVLDLAQKAQTDDAQILYLAESSNRAISLKDKDQRVISEMISNYYPMLKIGNISHDAYHAGMYYEVLHNIPKNSKVRAVIVTVNMRSFSAEWLYSNLEPALAKQRILAMHTPALYKRMLFAFQGYPHYSESERKTIITKALAEQKFHFPYFFPYSNAKDWDRAIGAQNRLFNGQIVSMDTIALTCHYIKNFAYELDRNNPRIRDLDKIVTLCKHRGWKLIFNILPENTEQARFLVGQDLLYLMHQNTEFVQNRYTKQGVLVVDNLDQVFDKDFIDRAFPTEHYCEAGRLTVALNVSEALSIYFPNDYHPRGSMNNGY